MIPFIMRTGDLLKWFVPASKVSGTDLSCQLETFTCFCEGIFCWSALFTAHRPFRSGHGRKRAFNKFYIYSVNKQLGRPIYLHRSLGKADTRLLTFPGRLVSGRDEFDQYKGLLCLCVVWHTRVSVWNCVTLQIASANHAYRVGGRFITI